MFFAKLLLTLILGPKTPTLKDLSPWFELLFLEFPWKSWTLSLRFVFLFKYFNLFWESILIVLLLSTIWPFTLVVTPLLDETLMVFEPNKSPISSSIPVSAVKIPTTIKNKTEKKHAYWNKNWFNFFGVCNSN